VAAKEKALPKPVSPADKAKHRAYLEGESRTQDYEATLDPRQRPLWFSSKTVEIVPM